MAVPMPYKEATLRGATLGHTLGPINPQQELTHLGEGNVF